MRQSSMENIEEREEEQKMDTQNVGHHVRNAQPQDEDADPVEQTPIKDKRTPGLKINTDERGFIGRTSEI